MLTRAIPVDAMPVVEVLRKDVPRPISLPVYDDDSEGLRWPEITKNDVPCCAMGLHPRALASPATPYGFDYMAPHVAIGAFADWFDEQQDPKAAVDAIWPQEESK